MIRVSNVRSLAALASLLVAVVALAGCAGESSGSGSAVDVRVGQPDVPLPPEDVQSTPEDVVGETKPGTDIRQGEGRLLFVDPLGDNDHSCVDYDRCMKLFETRNQTKALKVLYTEDEIPMAGVVLQYDIINLEFPDVARFPTAANGRALTGADGTTFIDLQVIDVAQAMQFAVQVTTPGKVDVQRIFFDIVVSKQGLPPLTVIPVYPENGPQRDLVTEVQVLLYRQVEDPAHPGNFLAGTVACDRLTPPVANESQLPAGLSAHTSMSVSLNASASFPVEVFPDLEIDGIQKYSVLAVGLDAGRVYRLLGCDDVYGMLEFGRNNSVPVPMDDLPPRLTGEFRVTSQFNLLSALPPDVQIWAERILGFFSDPSGTILELICLGGANVPVLGDLCDVLFEADGSQSLVASVITNIINSVIDALTEGTVWEDVFDTGADVVLILTELTFLSTIEFLAEPVYGDVIDEFGDLHRVGEIAEDRTYEEWDKIRYRWTLGTPACDADPEMCTAEFAFDDFTETGTAIQATFTGRVTFEADLANPGQPPKMMLTIDPHNVLIHYGQLINYMAKCIIIPMIAEPPMVYMEGAPHPGCWGYAALVQSLLAGGDCLTDTTTTCCRLFAENLVSQAGTVTVTLVESACEGLTTFGTQYLESLLTSLSGEAGFFHIGTAEPCELIDTPPNERMVDAMGRAGAECKWEAVVSLGNTEVTVDATFTGKR